MAVLAAYSMLLVAAGLQIVAAIYAFALISRLGWNRAWGLLAGAFLIQALRRIMAVGTVASPVTATALLDNSLLLLTSLLILAGVLALRPILMASQQAQAELRASTARSRRVIQALDHSQRQLNTLLDNLSGMAYRCPNVRGWPLEFVSEGCLKLTGYPSADLIGCRRVSYEDLIHPEDRERVWQAVQAAVETGQPFEMMYRLRAADGSEKWVWEQGMGVHDAGGELEALEGLIVDVTQLEEAHRALVQSEARYRMLAENVSDVIWVVGLDERFIYVSPSVEALWGYPPEEVIGQPVAALLTPEAIQQIVAFRARSEKFQATGEPHEGAYRFELPLPRKNGTTIWTEELLSLFYDQEGDLAGILGVSRDITDRRMMEAMLREQISLNDNILGTMQDGYLLFDAQGRLLEVNDAYVALSGYSRQELLQRTIADLEAVEGPSEVTGVIARALAQEGIRFETRHRHADGHLLAVEISVSALKWMDEPLLAAFVRDITQRRQMEEQIARDHTMLRVLIDNLPDHVYVKDMQGRFLIVNQALARSANAHSPEALLGKTGQEIFSQMLADYDGEPERRLLATGEPLINREEYLYLPNGEKQWLLTSKFPLRDRQGAIRGLVGIGRDVTILRRLLEVEHDQRLWAETLRDTALVLSQVTELDAVLDALLEQIERVVPHDGADIRLNEGGVSRMVRNRLYANYGDLLRYAEYELPIEQYANLRTITATRQPVRIDDIHQDPDWVLLDARDPMHCYLGVPILWEDTVIGAIQVLSTTPAFFTNRHADRLTVFAAEAAVAIQKARLFAQVQAYATRLEALVSQRTTALRASEARYRAIVEDQLEMVIRFTPDDGLTFANDAYCQMARAPFAALQGRSILELPLFRDRARFQDYLHSLTPERPVGMAEQPYATGEGPAWIQWTDRMIAAEPGGVLEYQSVGRDITRHKLMEQQLRHALEREISVGEMRTRFLSMAAHDLRNPLAAIKTTVDLLTRYSDRLPEEKKAARLYSANESIRTMVSMLDDILTIGRVESGRLEFQPALIALEPFCWQLVDEVIGATGAYDLIQVHCDLPPQDLFLDKRLLRHILSNLLSNAVKYSLDDTPIEFQARLQDGAIVFVVQDYGIGIPAEEQHLVYEFFHRFSNVGPIPGTGLGLAIVKLAVEIHGGAITFESEEHIGTTFTVTIPLNSPDDPRFNLLDTVEIEPEQKP